VKLAELRTSFELLTTIYRQCIESTRKSEDEEAGLTVVLEDLRQVASNVTASLVTELDMIAFVFEPILGEILSAKTPEQQATDEEASVGRDHTREEKAANISPRLTDALVLYFECLLRNQIYPHKRAQTFLFALCVSTKSFETLRQLLHYHVILDSLEIVGMLIDLAGVVPSEALKRWTTQMSLDMAWRLRDLDVLCSLLCGERINEPELFVTCLKKLSKQSDGWALVKFLEVLQMRLDGGSISVRRVEEIVDGIVDLVRLEDITPNMSGCDRWIDWNIS
jgi:hypothetical protein